MSDADQSSWQPPPAEASLAEDEVHVWRVPLERSSGLEILQDLLSKDERERADRFHFERHRRRFIAARGALRQILGGYAGRDPAELKFVYGEHGKPALDPGQAAGGLSFNLSHSHTLALCGVTRNRRIGIDIELVRANHEIEKTIDRFYSEKEKQAFRAVARTRWRAEFFRVWTRKEAFLKARGHGFFHSTRRFTVSVGPDEPPRLIEVAGEPDEASRWTVRDLAPAPQYNGAVVVEGDDWLLRQWNR